MSRMMKFFSLSFIFITEKILALVFGTEYKNAHRPKPRYQSTD